MEEAGDRRLLLVAARESAHGVRGGPATDPQPVDPASDFPALERRDDPPHAGDGPEGGERNVLRDGAAERETLLLPVLAQEPDALIHARRGRCVPSLEGAHDDA